MHGHLKHVKYQEYVVVNLQEPLLQPYIVPVCLTVLSWPLLPTHCRCKRLLLHLVTLNGTHTHTHIHIKLDWTPLDEGSARQETSTWQHTTLTTERHATGRIRTHNPSKRETADACLRPHDKRDRPFCQWDIQTVPSLFVHPVIQSLTQSNFAAV